MPGPAPPPILQPPLLFPALERRPLPLSNSDVHDYLVTIKQEFRLNALQSPFYLKESVDKRDVERYSDRYKNVKRNGTDDPLDWKPVWSFFPKELHSLKSKKRSKSTGEQSKQSKFKPLRTDSKKRKGPLKKRKRELDSPEADLTEENTDETAVKKKVKFSETPEEPITKKLEVLEKKESTGNESPKEEDEVFSDDEYYDEEIEEEGTDYNLTYFDNGEEYGGEDDEPLEEKDGAYY